MAAWWYRNTSDSDDTHDALASVIAQRAASPRRKSTTGPGRTPPLSCDDAHSTSSKGGRADPAAIAAAAASSAAAAAPSAVAVTLGCITRAAVVHRLSCSFNGASSCRPAALTLSWSGCPTSAREGGGNAVMKSARASADGPDSEQQPAGHGPLAYVRPASTMDERRSLLSDAVPSETFSFEAQRRSRASGIGQP